MKKLVLITLFLVFTCSITQQRLSAQEKLIISDKYIPHADTALVFMPKDYNKDTTYPLLLMLHGWSGNYDQWNSVTGGLQEYADKYKFIIICPDGFYDSWYLNSPIKEDSQFERFLFQAFFPKIFEQLKVDKNNIFITGLSMGGHGAVTLMLKHPDFFKSAGSTSGILDITAFPDSWGIKNMLGKFLQYPDNWRGNSALFLLDNIKGMNKQLIFDCGTEDFAYGVNKAFYEKCLDLKIKATFLSQPGAHTQNYWKNSIDNHFRFFYRLVQLSRNS